MDVIDIKQLNKVYANGFKALDQIDLSIHEGEIFALLGPNGAGKTTLISSICGLVQPSSGQILVNGLDNQQQYKACRRLIGLVPQELATDTFETVWDTVCFTRGLFGKPADPALIEQILRDLSLWDKKDNKIRTLSGGMKRRLMIAKALSHQPRILFLDEPSAGVDVELRKDMWQLVRKLREQGVTIILTTHYIEEAEEMADRIGVILRGQILLVDDKQSLMQKLGQKQLTLYLQQPLASLPSQLAEFQLELTASGQQLIYHFDGHSQNQIPQLLAALHSAQIDYKDLRTSESSLEDIFVSLVQQGESA